MATAGFISSLKIGVLIIGIGIVLLICAVSLDSHHRGEIYSTRRNTGRVKRSASESIPDIHPEAFSSILDFTMANIQRIMHRQPNNSKELQLEFLEAMTNQLVKKLNDDLQSIQDKVKEALDITINVFEYQTKVFMSLGLFRQHLNNPKVQKYIDDFKKEAATLPAALQALLDGQLGQNATTVDVVASLRDAFQCHGPNLQMKFKSMMRIFMAGLGVYYEYRWMLSAASKNNSSFNKPNLMLSSWRLLKRLDEEVSLCRTNERNVTAEMERTIMEAKKTHRDTTTIANNLLFFLENKYDTKKWVVIVVLSKNSRNGKPIAYPLECDGHHRTDTDGFVAVAISVDRIGNPKFDELVWARLNDSMLQNEKPEVKSLYDRSFHMNPEGPNPNEKAACDYLNRIYEPLEKLKGEGGFCYLTLWKNCNMSDLTIVTSNNATWAKQVLFQDVRCFGSIQVLTLALNKTTYANTDKKVWQKQEIENGMKRIVNNVALRRDRVVLKKIDSALSIHQDLNGHFGKLWAGKLESAVITTPCNDVRKEKIFDYTTVVASNDLRWMPVMDEDACSQMLIVVLPKVARVDATSEFD